MQYLNTIGQHSRLFIDINLHGLILPKLRSSLFKAMPCCSEVGQIAMVRFQQMDHWKHFFLTFATFYHLLAKRLKFCKFRAYKQQYGEKWLSVIMKCIPDKFIFNSGFGCDELFEICKIWMFLWCKCYKFATSNVINLPKNRISIAKSASVVWYQPVLYI